MSDKRKTNTDDFLQHSLGSSKADPSTVSDALKQRAENIQKPTNNKESSDKK